VNTAGWILREGRERFRKSVIHDTGACHTDGFRGNVRVGHSVLGTPLELGHGVPERFNPFAINFEVA